MKKKKKSFFEKSYQNFQSLINKQRELFIFQFLGEKGNSGEVAKQLKSGKKFDRVIMIMLLCACSMACVGLYQGSTAVLIGAMLLSPLMLPIMAIGYGLSSLKADVFYSGILSLFFQICIILLISWLYFNNFGLYTPNEQLLGRINPSINDVIIALSGGTAGSLSIFLSKHQVRSSSAFGIAAAVAIGTALIPPVCTIGYGIAINEPEFYTEAFVLFGVNATSIITSMAVLLWFFKIGRVRLTKFKQYFMFVILGACIFAVGTVVVPETSYMLAKSSIERHVFTSIHKTEENKEYAFEHSFPKIDHRGKDISFVIYMEKNVDKTKHIIDYLQKEILKNDLIQKYKYKLRITPLANSHAFLNLSQENQSNKEKISDLEKQVTKLIEKNDEFQKKSRETFVIDSISAEVVTQVKSLVKETKGLTYLGIDIEKGNRPFVDIVARQQKGYSNKHVKSLRDTLNSRYKQFDYELTVF